MNSQEDLRRKRNPPFERQSNGFDGIGVELNNAKRQLGLDCDPVRVRARMTEKDQLKYDAIIEVGLERLERKKEDQEYHRPGLIREEMNAIKKMLEEFNLSAEPKSLAREAEGNIHKNEQRQLAVIRRETRVQLERHETRCFGRDRQHVSRRTR